MASFFAKKSSQSHSKDKHPALKWMGRFFMGLGVLMFISLIISIVSLVTIFKGKDKVEPLPDQFVLAHTLTASLPEKNSVTPFMAQFFPPELTLYNFLKSLEVAKDDAKVTSLVIRINDGDYSMTQIQTLRNAILDFRQSGKKTYAISDNYGGFSNGLGEYWLASAFDEIWLQPVGTVSINGIRIEQPFFKNALNKIGVEFEMEARKSYKTGPEMYLRNSMSPENRETINDIVDDAMGIMKTDIKAARKMSEQKLMVAIDNSPLIAEEARGLGLIDTIGYVDELEDKARTVSKNTDDDAFIGFARYQQEVTKKVKYKEGVAKVAMVYVEGAIMDVDALASINQPLAAIIPSDIADAKIISAAISDAADDDGIEVIIIRINSPGGSPTASEKIRRAIVQAKEKGKYIIVSMADVAASGGYWIAVDADEIIASDLTLTGSIGVYGGKPDLSGLWEKLGVSWGAVEYGQNASMWTTNVGMSDSERKRLNIMMDRTYIAFIDRVSQGRKLTGDNVEKVAQGRAWTGMDAAPRGLVDDIGGYDLALDIAAKRTGYDDWKTMPIILLPRRDDTLKDIAKLLGLPSIKDAPKLPQMMIPAIANDAVITAPYLRVDF